MKNEISNNNQISSLFNKLLLSFTLQDNKEMLIILSDISSHNFCITKNQIYLLDECLKSLLKKKRDKRKNLRDIISNLKSSKRENYIEDAIDISNWFQMNEISYPLDIKIKINILNGILEEINIEMILFYQELYNIYDNFEENLLNFNSNIFIKLFIIKEKADYKRYLYEIYEEETIENNDNMFLFNTSSIKKDDLLYDVDILYNKGIISALEMKKSIYKDEIIYFRFFINYTVYLHDLLKNKEKAIDTAKEILQEGLFIHEKINDNKQKDIFIACQILKENISFWSKT